MEKLWQIHLNCKICCNFSYRLPWKPKFLLMKAKSHTWRSQVALAASRSGSMGRTVLGLKWQCWAASVLTA